MSQGVAAQVVLRWRRDAEAGWRAPDTRRRMQLGLAALWLLDAVLQLQSFMFTKAFGQMLAGTAAGNPAVIAGPIRWAAQIVGQHPTATDAGFAVIQLLIGLGIIWRPTVKAALAASIGWSAAVWWFGEGLGGVLSGSASPLDGAPGAVILYGLLAVLLWPASRAGRSAAPFPAAQAVGSAAARWLWLLLWATIGYFAVQPAANRAPQALHDMISQLAPGEPRWLAGLDHAVAGLLAGQGLTASIVIAAVCAVLAAGIFLPAPGARVTVALAVLVAAVLWVIGQDFGAIFTGSATDPNSGPLLALLAAAYWPARGPGPGPASPATELAPRQTAAR
jgi:hypothetical protein